MMHLPASAEGCHIFKRDMSDSKISFVSGISEDIKESPKGTQHSSARHVDAKHNLDEIHQPPAGAGKGNRKKTKLGDGVPGNSTVLTTREYSERISTLQELRKKEKELKIAIAYEKLIIEQPIILDTDILQDKIAEYQRLLKEARNEHKMKNVMCVNLQLANTLQRIVGETKTKQKAIVKQNGFSDSQRMCIEDLLKKRKELNRSIGIKRKKIAETDEDVLKLEKVVSNNEEKKSKLVAECDFECTSSKRDNLKELERLKESNEKVADRIHLLSHIIQSLVPHTGRQEESDLLDMMAECEKVSKSQLDNLDDINALLTSVRSVNL